MRYLKIKRILISVIFALAVSVIVLIGEMKWIIKDNESLGANTYLVFVFQFVFLSLAFLIIPEYFKSLKMWLFSHGKFSIIEKCGLLIPILTTIIFILFILLQNKIMMIEQGTIILGALSIVIGISYFKAMNAMHIMFIECGFAIWMLHYLLTNIGIVGYYTN